MSWDEVDAAHTLWSIPAPSMKASKPHEVPLCDEAREILGEMCRRRHPKSKLVFPSVNGKLLSDVGINKVLHGLPTVKRLDEAATARLRANARTKEEKDAQAHGATVHGFRSTARSWAAAKTSVEPFVLELVLAHQNKDKVEAAYQLDTASEKRAPLMAEWNQYCCGLNVIRFARSLAVRFSSESRFRREKCGRQHFAHCGRPQKRLAEGIPKAVSCKQRLVRSCFIQALALLLFLAQIPVLPRFTLTS